MKKLIILTIAGILTPFMMFAEGGQPTGNGILIMSVLMMFLLLIIVAISMGGFGKKYVELKGDYKKVEGVMGAFTGAVDLEAERDILLDHDYDGIKELDNKMPPWWLWLFYITIFIGVGYVLNYHLLGTSELQEEAYTLEMDKAQASIDSYKSAHPELFTVKKEFVTGEAELAFGKTLFIKNCAPCHKPDGGGVVGPNLTDPEWINGCDVESIFTIIMDGSKTNPTMQEWKSKLTTKEIQQVASFVNTLIGTNAPGGKAAEGVKCPADPVEPVEVSEEVK